MSVAVVRWTARQPCPVCAGWEAAPRGRGERCSGFLGGNGRIANCTREERAGLLDADQRCQPPAFPHRLCRACDGHHEVDGGPDHDVCRCSAQARTARRRTDRVDGMRGELVSGSVIERRYEYADAEGVVRFWTVRYDPKAFLPLRPVSGRPAVHECRRCGCRHEGSHAMKGHVEPIPYRLPDLLADERRLLLIVEGERDVDTARDDLGFPATTAAGWCDWTVEQARMVPAHRVLVIVPDQGDPDHTGERRGARAAAAFRAAGFAPRRLDLPNGAKDLTAWREAGGDADALGALIGASPVWPADALEQALPGTAPLRVLEGGGTNGSNGHGGNGVSRGTSNGHGPTPAEISLVEFTDWRNAKRLSARDGERLRYDHTRGQWRAYDGVVWRLDETEEVTRRAKVVVEHLPDEIEPITAWATENMEAKDAEKLLTRLRREALACESTSRIRALVQNAQSELYATHETWDPDPWALNCTNGTVDLRTGDLRPHRPQDWQSKLAPVAYDPDATAPLWEAFLRTIFADARGVADEQLIQFVQRAVGLSLIGEVIEHVLLVCYGTGMNGKGTFVQTLQGLLGDYAREGSASLLADTKYPQHLTTVAELRGVRFVNLSEQGSALSEDTVKWLTGGDQRNANFMHKDHFTYMPSDTFWLQTNHQPSMSGFSEGIRRRLRMIPFTVRIPDASDVKRYHEVMLRAEGAGILAWAVRGCLDYQRNKLGTADAITATTEAYWNATDSMAQFIDQCCIIRVEALVSAADLYKAYQGWCTEAGEKPASKRFFGLRMTERGYRSTQYGKARRHHWLGLCLSDPDNLFPDDPSPTRSVQSESMAGGGEPMATTQMDMGSPHDSSSIGDAIDSERTQGTEPSHLIPGTGITENETVNANGGTVMSTTVPDSHARDAHARSDRNQGFKGSPELAGQGTSIRPVSKGDSGAPTAPGGDDVTASVEASFTVPDPPDRADFADDAAFDEATGRYYQAVAREIAAGHLPESAWPAEGPR